MALNGAIPRCKLLKVGDLSANAAREAGLGTDFEQFGSDGAMTPEAKKEEPMSKKIGEDDLAEVSGGGGASEFDDRRAEANEEDSPNIGSGRTRY